MILLILRPRIKSLAINNLFLGNNLIRCVGYVCYNLLVGASIGG